MHGSVGALAERRNQLFYGDNLNVLREQIASESVDLIYLDPPFNSNANYNLLFREPEGLRSQAQIEAFEDTWQWSVEAEEAYDDVLSGDNQRLSRVLHALRDALGDNSMMAYLAMMAVRLIELHRVLKRTGSFYLHCDPTASHYLKVLLDAVFGPRAFRNEIIWKRTSSHNDASQGLSRFGRTHDVIFFYQKDRGAAWNVLYAGYSPAYIKQHYSNVDASGRRFKTSDLTAAKPGGDVSYEWKGVRPPRGRFWAYSRANMEKFEAEGRLVYAAKSGMPRLKHYLDKMPGVPMGDVWDDIPPVNSQAQERLGYPTQKPIELLERVLNASTKEGDVVLDPFCGCGTTIHASQRLGRRWIGIDVTHLAISLIESRLVSAFPNIDYELFGTPKDFAGACALADRNKHQFEWWALSLVKAQPANDKKKGADKGIDGLLWLRVGQRERAKVVVSVKGGRNISVEMVRDLWGVLQRENAAIGLFVTLYEPKRTMIAEAAKAGFYEWEGNRYLRIQILTIEELLSGVRPELPLIDHAALVKPAQVDRARESQPALI